MEAGGAQAWDLTFQVPMLLMLYLKPRVSDSKLFPQAKAAH